MNPLVRMFHVTKRYASACALADVNLEIARGSFFFLTGPSGAGKSTLLKLIHLVETPSEGQILFDGMNLARISRSRIPVLRRRMGFVFQDYKLIATRSIYENVALVMEAGGKRGRLVEKKVASVLRLVGMEDRQSAYPPSLSGGEQQRVAVARAVVGDPDIILADEPTGSLDDHSACVVIELLKRFHALGGTVIVATHDADLVRSIPAAVLYLEKGRLASIKSPVSPSCLAAPRRSVGS
jgi:cell division transport system ATP-binding protein